MNMEKTHIPDIQAESVSLMCALAFHIKNMYARKGVAYTGLCTPFLNLYKYSYFSCKGMSHVNNHDLSARYAIQALISNNYKSSSTINTPSKFPARL